ncbi:MAG: hypothetical protein EA390_02540 [Balneolaceae bacterium]|nr:MAG: hypothetical protein EA390_02540 [Balneolaceae bacterium]
MKQAKYILSILIFASLAFASCSEDSTSVNIEDPDDNNGDDIVTIDDNTTELVGQMRGTLRSGRTYELVGDLIIPDGEAIVAEAGVTIIAVGDGGDIGPEITIHGAFHSLGTADNPNLLTVPANLRTHENRFAGLWGGLQGSETTASIVLKHTRMEFFGGEGGPGTPRAGRIRYGIWTLSDQTEVVLEDSWFYGSKDDFYRPVGGKLNIVRNVFEEMGEDGGDIINVKGGTVGNIAYNLVIGGATNAFKPSDDGESTIQSTIGIYNNTILNSGFRRAGLNRGANINFENGARGFAYNNLIVNNKRGIRVLDDSDLTNIDIDYNLYYGTHQEMAEEFIPTDSEGSTQQVLGENNIYGGPGDNNPLFVDYDIDLYTMSDYNAGENQPLEMNIASPWNFRLQAGSPAIGAGSTDFSPISVSFTLTGDAAPTILAPNADIGAYTSAGDGLTQN